MNALRPDVRVVKSLAQVPEIPGFQRKFSGAIVSRDAAFNLGIRHKSPVVYYLARADRAYYYVAARKAETQPASMAVEAL